ncbi:MAG: HigA family addiction module antidote protein [Aestuariibacter sp.]|nr:HigA family addiction module antidote protein [Aestuariibacter sp.]
MTNSTFPDFVKLAPRLPLDGLEVKKRPDGGFRKHPSDFFKRHCLTRVGKMTNKAVAEHLGVTPKHLSNFLNEKVNIEPAFAVRLAKATGIGMGTWLELQRQYNAYKFADFECDVKPLYAFGH